MEQTGETGKTGERGEKQLRQMQAATTGETVEPGGGRRHKQAVKKQVKKMDIGVLRETGDSCKTEETQETRERRETEETRKHV